MRCDLTWLRQLLPLDVPGFTDPVFQIQGPIDIPIESLVYATRRVTTGTLFFALPATKTEGTAFL